MKNRLDYTNLRDNIFFCIAAPLFMMLFVVIYDPRFGYDYAQLQEWEPQLNLCLPILVAIQLGVLMVSRALICFAPFAKQLKPIEYFYWMLFEFVLTCLFFCLFLSLHFHTSYFQLLPRTLLLSLCIHVFSYTIFFLALSLKARDQRLREVNRELDELRQANEEKAKGVLQFNDEKGNTKLVVNADVVITIESAGNYLTVLYSDNGKLVRCTLRNTLKSVEELCANSELVRCHRSYFVNLGQIKVLRRTSDGLFAEMLHPGVPAIPISKTFAPELLRRFSIN